MRAALPSAAISLALSPIKSFTFTPSRRHTIQSTARFISMSSSTAAANYPRPLSSGGFSLPPLVEDLLPIVTECRDESGNNTTLRTDLILIRPPGMEELWEWLAYTKRQSEGDPSWGRVWPTALSMARFIKRSFHSSNPSSRYGVNLVDQAVDALKTTSHVVELGCGLGVAGLAYATMSSSIPSKRTVTFLDREPYALHCVMSSAAMNKLNTAPLVHAESDKEASDSLSLTIVRASVDDWTVSNESGDGNSKIKNIGYRDLGLGSSIYDNQYTTILASDILYEPASMKKLARKIHSLMQPNEGGYALISDPKEERTEGCRDSFVSSVKELGGDVAIVPLQGPAGSVGLVEGDIDIDGSLASTLLIVVHFPGKL
eukprot:scaffold10683_cov94-Cyclotella_meneghiniana.AAC.5